jgi:hypothetical protein
MEREIHVTASGGYITKDNTFAGVVGEGGATTLVLSFDESWAGLTKTVTFYDAQGLNPVAVILTIETMQDSEGLSYAIPIPSEPLAVEGEMSFVVDGAADGVRQRAFEDRLEVKYAPAVTDGAEPVSPTPTEAEQLQAEIDAMLGQFLAYRDEAAASAASASESAISAEQSAISAAGYLAEIGTARDEAVASAAAAAISQTAAASSESAAGLSAGSASASATSATASASAAAASESAAETAQLASESARNTAVSAKIAAESARDTAVAAKDTAVAAQTAAQASAASAGNSASAAAASEGSAETSAAASESWAVGGTGTRTGEDTNNAKYWSDQAALAAGGGVSSFNGRAGAVAPQTGDYTASMVGADPRAARRRLSSRRDRG